MFKVLHMWLTKIALHSLGYCAATIRELPGCHKRYYKASIRLPEQEFIAWCGFLRLRVSTSESYVILTVQGLGTRT